MNIYCGNTFYNSTDIKDAAKLYLSNLPRDVTHLICKGSSGCAIASAMLALHKGKKELRSLVVRKDNENNHSGKTVGFPPYNIDGHIACFVDDFISTGFTFKSILDWAADCGISIKYSIVGHDSNEGHLAKEHGIKLIVV
jgi:adenine/guanine phosphoribosyltransferase-like PRPP-binding protein